MLKYVIFLYLCVATYAVFMPQDDSAWDKAVDIHGTVDEEVEKGRFVLLQIVRTTTTTSTSVTSLSTFTICLKAYSTASSCKASGRKRRSAAVEEVIHNRVERAINEKPYNEETLTKAIAASNMDALSGVVPDEKGRFLLPSVSSTTTTVSTTSTSTSYTAIITVTASSCNTDLIVPASFCLAG